MNLFRNRSREDPKTPPASPPSRRASKILFRSQSGSNIGSPSKPPVPVPESPSKRAPLSIANVANIFIKMRRASDQVKPWRIESSSGEDPQSHPGVEEAVTSTAREPLWRTDVFICDGAVNGAQLLRVVRNTLMELAELIGANALVDERCVTRPGFLRIKLHIPLCVGGTARSWAPNTGPMGLLKCR